MAPFTQIDIVVIDQSLLRDFDRTQSLEESNLDTRDSLRLYEAMNLHPDDVFIPGGLPQETYVSRRSSTTEQDLRRWLSRRQKPLLSVSGPTKSGKTVLLKKLVVEGIWLSGGAIDSANDFWLEICEQLEVFTDHVITGARGDSQAAGGSAGFNGGVSGQVHGKFGREYSSTIARSRAGDPRSSARKALKANLDRIIVIDDFHYITPDDQLSIVRGLKDLIFDGLGVVVAAVPHRAYDVVRVEKEMTGRVETLPVTNWESEDLKLIGTQGFTALGLGVDDDILNELVKESFTSPHLMQTHCLQLCFMNTIDGEIESKLVAPEWREFFERQASATSKSAFDLLKAGPRTRTDRARRKLKNGTETDIYGVVLHAIEHTGPRTTLTYDEVRAALRDVLESELPQRHEITNVLGQMTKIARDRIDGEPVLEYDEEYSTLHLIDPYFAYYLRWASSEMKDIMIPKENYLL